MIVVVLPRGGKATSSFGGSGEGSGSWAPDRPKRSQHVVDTAAVPPVKKQKQPVSQALQQKPKATKERKVPLKFQDKGFKKRRKKK